jgi:hypothetical protein
VPTVLRARGEAAAAESKTPLLDFVLNLSLQLLLVSYLVPSLSSIVVAVDRVSGTKLISYSAQRFLPSFRHIFEEIDERGGQWPERAIAHCCAAWCLQERQRERERVAAAAKAGISFPLSR